MKGLALAGALEAFAVHPKWKVDEWVNVAGASAGAIIAAFIACNPSGDVGQRMLEVLDPKELASFQDFPLHSKIFGGIPRLLLDHGMAPGNAFERWLDKELQGATFKGMLPVGSEGTSPGGGPDWRQSRLRLIACDVTNRLLLVLPEDLPKYRLPGTDAPFDPASFPIARAVRMSMSIPYFFSPVVLERMVDAAGKPLATPRRSLIVDGGTLSNFPVWLFDAPQPQRPTFGFTLDGGSGVGAGFNRAVSFAPWLVRFGFDIFHTAQDAWDERFTSASTTVRTIVSSATVIDAQGVPHPINTTDFAIPPDLQQRLVQNGRDAANKFLATFNPANYFNSTHS